MANCVDKFILDDIETIENEAWGNGGDFGTLDCCKPFTLVWSYLNTSGQDIRIDGVYDSGDFDEPHVVDDSRDIISIVRISGFTRDWIAPGDKFTIAVTVDPSLANCEICGSYADIEIAFEVVYDLITVEPPCEGGFNISVDVKSKIPPTIALGAQGDLDGFVQYTTDVGTPISKGITIANNDCIDRVYTIEKPDAWDARFTADFDLFSPFTIETRSSQEINITYLPTEEEINCLPLEIVDDCEDSFSIELCYEATLSAPVDPVDPVDPPPVDPGECLSAYVDCDNMNIGIEQLFRMLLVKDENGCPAIRTHIV